MNSIEWARICERHFTSSDFESAVRQMLRAIRDADDADRPRRMAEFGGLMRRERNHARTLLASAMMQELGIEPTQHVAEMIMRRTFGTAASTAWLDRFAEPGRDASIKHTASARALMELNAGTVLMYAWHYDWFCDELKRHKLRLRLSLDAAPSTPAGGPKRARRSGV